LVIESAIYCCQNCLGITFTFLCFY